MLAQGIRKILLLLGVGLLATTVNSQEHASEPMGPPPEPDFSRVQQEMAEKAAVAPLRVTYERRSDEWTAAKLEAIPQTSITVYNAHSKVNETYTGVPVLTLLTQLGFPDKPHGKDYKMYLVAEGADGYSVVYAMAEVIPTIHDATVIVADSINGKPLGPAGPLELVATGEKHPARWVRNLVSIRVETAH
jgi:hypothetical protein